VSRRVAPKGPGPQRSSELLAAVLITLLLLSLVVSSRGCNPDAPEAAPSPSPATGFVLTPAVPPTPLATDVDMTEDTTTIEGDTYVLAGVIKNSNPDFSLVITEIPLVEVLDGNGAVMAQHPVEVESTVVAPMTSVPWRFTIPVDPQRPAGSFRRSALRGQWALPSGATVTPSPSAR
jgi:hypothetical protein